MEQLLYQWPTLQAWVSDCFSGEMLSPIIQNLLLKARTGWDDYNEVYHCCQFIHTVQSSPRLHTEFHTLRRDGAFVGIGLITDGDIASPLFFPKGLAPTEPASQALVFNYFHIAPDARGTGEQWLRKVILPRCQQQGYQALYVKSSHPKVFSLYTRLGQVVGHYCSHSDNGLFDRPGTMFRIPLSHL